MARTVWNCRHIAHASCWLCRWNGNKAIASFRFSFFLRCHFYIYRRHEEQLTLCPFGVRTLEAHRTFQAHAMCWRLVWHTPHTHARPRKSHKIKWKTEFKRNWDFHVRFSPPSRILSFCALLLRCHPHDVLQYVVRRKRSYATTRFSVRRESRRWEIFEWITTMFCNQIDFQNNRNLVASVANLYMMRCK